MLNANGLDDAALETLMDTSMIEALHSNDTSNTFDLLDKIEKYEEFKTIHLLDLNLGEIYTGDTHLCPEIEKGQQCTSPKISGDHLGNPEEHIGMENEDLLLASDVTNSAHGEIQSTYTSNESGELLRNSSSEPPSELSTNAKLLKSQLMLDSLFCPSAVQKHLTAEEIHHYIEILTKRLNVLQYLYRKKTGFTGKLFKDGIFLNPPQEFLDLFECPKISPKDETLEDIPNLKCEQVKSAVDEKSKEIVQKQSHLQSTHAKRKGKENLVPRKCPAKEIRRLKMSSALSWHNCDEKRMKANMALRSPKVKTLRSRKEKISIRKSNRLRNKDKVDYRDSFVAECQDNCKANTSTDRRSSKVITADDFLEVYSQKKQKKKPEASRVHNDEDELTVEQSLEIIDRTRRKVQFPCITEIPKDSESRKALCALAGNGKATVKKRKKISEHKCNENCEERKCVNAKKQRRISSIDIQIKEINEELKENSICKRQKKRKKIVSPEFCPSDGDDSNVDESQMNKKEEAKCKKLHSQPRPEDLDLLAVEWNDETNDEQKKLEEDSQIYDSNWKEEVNDSSEEDGYNTDENNINKDNSDTLDIDDDGNDSESSSELEEINSVAHDSSQRSSNSVEKDAVQRRRRRRRRRKGRCAYDPSYIVPESVTVDYYGNLILPGDLHHFNYELDADTYDDVTGWERIDDFRYLFCLSVEPILSRQKSGRWIRFAKVMKALGSDKTNSNCSDHVNIYCN